MPRLPRFARAEVRAYNKEIREKRIAERNWRETLERIVATLQAFGQDAKISPTVPTIWNWEIELESEASDLDSDSDSDSDSPEYVYIQAARLIGKEYRKEEQKVAYQQRLETRAAAVAAAIATTTA